jgi:hypothetical protein
LTPSARSGNLIAGDGTKNGLFSEQRTVRKTQKQSLDRKSPIQVSSELGSEPASLAGEPQAGPMPAGGKALIEPVAGLAERAFHEWPLRNCTQNFAVAKP